MNKILFLLLFSILSSCAYYSPIYWGWGEWAGPGVTGRENQALTGFSWSKLPGIITLIDGDSVGTGYKMAKLLPGRHIIEYAYYPVEFGIHPKGLIEIELKAGHNYEFRLKLCYSCIPRRYSMWVSDKTSDEIVWGEFTNPVSMLYIKR